MGIVELQPFDAKRHLTLVESWLRRPHVAPWWGETEPNLSDIRRRPVDQAAIITLKGGPVGYLCWQRPPPAELEEAGLTDLPNGLVDVDIMIGDPQVLGQGVGPEALRQFIRRVKTQNVPVVGIAAAVANQRALRAYEKAGFQPFRDFFEGGEVYRYFTKALF